jgi:uncharacterized Zn-binding protein involved in type VI secretion
MRKVIRVGDSTSHGGKVISSAAPHFTVDGKPVACIGDKCTCPIVGHGGVCTIIDGDAQHTIDGRQVAYEGHKTSCGASLMATGNKFRKG